MQTARITIRTGRPNLLEILENGRVIANNLVSKDMESVKRFIATIYPKAKLEEA